MPGEIEKEIWAIVHRHVQSMLTRDIAGYEATTSADLSLYEWFITPHRQDGLPFHLFMIENNWFSTDGEFRYDLWEPRLQVYGETAIVSYTFMLSMVTEDGITHKTHNESRVLVRGDQGWQIVHVHKSPAWQAPLAPD